jgi:hypothetical protein
MDIVAFIARPSAIRGLAEAARMMPGGQEQGCNGSLSSVAGDSYVVKDRPLINAVTKSTITP